LQAFLSQVLAGVLREHKRELMKVLVSPTVTIQMSYVLSLFIFSFVLQEFEKCNAHRDVFFGVV